jgi:aminoglycoside phosphotransferase (APT) family kinase protein
MAPAGIEAWVRDLVANVAGGPVGPIERMGYGHASVTYRAADLIVRTHHDPSVYLGTLDNLAALRDLGLPVPTVLAADLTCTRYPFAYLVTDAFPGRDLGFVLADLTPAQCSRVAEQVVSFERAVATLPSTGGYGFRPIGATGGHRRWIDAIRADRADDTAALLGFDDAELGALNRDVWSRLDAVSHRLEPVPPTCFLDDLTTKNVIVDAGELRGVVDFDVVCYGDPMYWLALARVGVVSDVGAPGDFYVDELIRHWAPTDVEHANLAVYSALHASAFLTWDRDDTARRRRLLSAARTWLDTAGP